MNIVYVPGATVLPLIDERHFGFQLRRDVRAGAPDRRAGVQRPCRSWRRMPQQIAAAFDRPAVGDLDPLAALV